MIEASDEPPWPSRSASAGVPDRRSARRPREVSAPSGVASGPLEAYERQEAIVPDASWRGCASCGHTSCNMPPDPDPAAEELHQSLVEKQKLFNALNALPVDLVPCLQIVHAPRRVAGGGSLPSLYNRGRVAATAPWPGPPARGVRGPGR